MSYNLKVTTNFNRFPTMTTEMTIDEFVRMTKHEIDIYLNNWVDSDRSEHYDARFKITKLEFDKQTGNVKLVEYTEMGD